MKILVVDDHAIMRRGLKEILIQDMKSVEFGEANDAKEALKMASRSRWDVVILDINLAGRNGLDVLRDIRKMRPNLPILVLSMFQEDHVGVRIIKAGASGYLNKESAPDELAKAVKKIVSGERYITPSVAEELAVSLESRTDALPHKTLSDREYQVLIMISSGKTPAQIARELCISPKTVSCYRARILEKMNMENNLGLISYALRNKLVD